MHFGERITLRCVVLADDNIRNLFSIDIIGIGIEPSRWSYIKEEK